jgi:L-amino acid N-acyltransferase YncA
MRVSAVQSGSFQIRAAQAGDLPQITAIYAHFVRTHTATFELDPPDQAEMTARWAKVRAASLPYTVAADDDEILGYCYVTPYRPRPAYRFTLENSIYIAKDQQRRGIGGALLKQVLDVCQRQGYREVIAIIGDSQNAASIGLHRQAGFVHVGTLRNVGFKFDRWLDSVIMQRSL